jgi:predicted protein tyrosine phosphatase
VAVPRLFTVERPGPGSLSTATCPPGNQQLAGALEEIAAHGADLLVSMLRPAEEARLGLTDEQWLASRAGLDFRRLPTRDFGAPDLAATAALAAELTNELARGRHLVLHCRGGVGRSATLAAAVLLYEGVGPDQAWRLIASARGKRVPETRAQRRLIATLARRRFAEFE